MQDIISQLNSDLTMLQAVIDERFEVAQARSNAEYAYRVALGKAMAAAKLNGMAATALYEYCRGMEEIADLRCKRDILQAQEDRLSDLIYYYRTDIRVNEGHLAAERKGL